MIDVASAMPDSPPPSAPIGAPSALHDTRRPFVVVTGLSGAGRITALHALDDMGYVAVDNLPLPLLGDLMRSTAGNPGEMAPPLAFGVDTRTHGFDPHELVRHLRRLRERSDISARLLFLECETET
ncbi:MAG: RNase adapter RapZ, partial [Reyranella sp.]